MLTRENLKLLVVAVACLLVAWTGPAVAHGVHAKFAHNADRVDGKHAVGAGAGLTKARGKLVAHNGKGRLPAKFVPKSFVTEAEYESRTSKIVTTHGHAAWVPSRVPPGVVRFREATRMAQTGSLAAQGMVLALHGPSTVGGTALGLEKVQICYRAGNGGFITHTGVNATDGSRLASLVEDPTDRTSSSRTCYTVAVGQRVLSGSTLYVELGPDSGFVDLSGVRAVWSRSAAGVAPPLEP